MSFLSLRSPKGGRSLREWAITVLRNTNRTFSPPLPEDNTSAMIVEDYWAIQLGYCTHCATKLYATKSVCYKVYKILDSEFKYSKY